ncbi:MAG TPA: molybdenum cofactor biosynthesis protein MoaE [Acidimicrobiia bacterium]|jgi:molybdopterin synthase catalytic subunit
MVAQMRIRVGEAAIDAGSLVAEVGRPDSGATVLFLGTVRDHSDGRDGVTHLVYEAYVEHVESRIHQVCEEASEKWPVLSMAVEHRVGRVELGEASVAVAVSSAHRGDAFDAGEYIIDELKSRAPIWKQENWPGGQEWIEGA